MTASSALVLLPLMVAALLKTSLSQQTLTTEGCGERRGCWFQPEKCELLDVNKCVSSVQWTTEPDGVTFLLTATIVDLNIAANGRYLALGFSKNDRMDDDSVVECVFQPRGEIRAYNSFNDMTHNKQLLQATEVMLTNSSGSIINDRMMCTVKWLFAGRERVEEQDRFKIFDLPSRPWTLQLARGYADPRSWSKYIHSTTDGDLFPWVTTEEVRICHDCTKEERFHYVKDMKQTDISRYWRYRFATIHGILLIFGWWVLGSNAILLARFFKPLWPNKKLFGTAIWFQLHRDLFVVSVCIQVIAVLLIFVQSSFTWYGCTYECNLEAFAFKLHVNLGAAATGCAMFQPFFAFLRPGGDSRWRPWFNWLHWFVGMGAWMCATVAMFLSVTLGKTGLYRVFGRVPFYIMGVYISVFIACSICLEMLASQSAKRTHKTGQHGMELMFLNGPTTEDPAADYPPRANLRPVLLLVHLLVAIAAASWISYMLVHNMFQH